MRSLTTYSVNPYDDLILNELAPQFWHLSQDQQVAIAIAALYEAYEPDAICFDYERCPSRRYDECIELIQLLSKPGKLALGQAILEHLAVVEMTRKREGAAASDIDPS